MKEGRNYGKGSKVKANGEQHSSFQTFIIKGFSFCFFSVKNYGINMFSIAMSFHHFNVI